MEFGKANQSVHLALARFGIAQRITHLNCRAFQRKIKIDFRIGGIEEIAIAAMRAPQINGHDVFQKRSVGIDEEQCQQSVVDEIILLVHLLVLQFSHKVLKRQRQPRFLHVSKVINHRVGADFFARGRNDACEAVVGERLLHAFRQFADKYFEREVVADGVARHEVAKENFVVQAA